MASLHGGVIATCFDAVGGYKAIHEIYFRTENVNLAKLTQRVSRLVTKTMQLEYLRLPRGRALTICRFASRIVNIIGRWAVVRMIIPVFRNWVCNILSSIPLRSSYLSMC
jgi:hypothetical protein